jgi:hypothetical protein
MKKIINFLNKFVLKEPTKIMGRWHVEKCDIKTNKKIDFANEDHCGPCGNETIKNNPEEEAKKNLYLPVSKITTTFYKKE